MAEASDTSERGLERLICTALAGHACDPPKEGKVAEVRAGHGGVGWSGGSPHDYDREFCVDGVQLSAFLHATQPRAAAGVVVMDARDWCQELQRSLGALYMCSEHGDYQRIRTPYLYPDGDVIDLFCKAEGDTVTVSDLAETTGWLRMQSAALRRSAKQRLLIEDACLTHGVEFYSGMVQARCRPGEELAQVVTRVAQAAIRVSDLWFTFRAQGVQTITDEVAEFLTERELGFDRREKLAGRSGRGWTVDFHVRTERRSSLVQVLSTGNRAAAHRVSEHVLAAWHDLNHLAAGPEALTFVSLFDDTADVWADEDFRLVEPLSTVSRWSRPDEFAAVLSEAA